MLCIKLFINGNFILMTDYVTRTLVLTEKVGEIYVPSLTVNNHTVKREIWLDFAITKMWNLLHFSCLLQCRLNSC